MNKVVPVDRPRRSTFDGDARSVERTCFCTLHQEGADGVQILKDPSFPQESASCVEEDSRTLSKQPTLLF